MTKKTFAECTITGRRRENQDRVLCGVFRKRPFIAAVMVADGMGGHQDGDKAAQMAVDELADMLKSNRLRADRHDLNRGFIQQALVNANRRILKYSRDRGSSGGMGTTVSGAVVVENAAYVFNVGDSRTYAVDGDSIEKLTADHTADQDALDRGIITADEMGKTPYANALVRALGTNQEMEVDFFPSRKNTAFALDEPMVLMACTDGLWSKVGAAEMERELRGRRTLEESVANLVSLSFLNKSTDNITVAAMEVGRLRRGKPLDTRYPNPRDLENAGKARNSGLRRLAWGVGALLLVLLGGLGFLLVRDKGGVRDAGFVAGEKIVKSDTSESTPDSNESADAESGQENDGEKDVNEAKAPDPTPVVQAGEWLQWSLEDDPLKQRMVIARSDGSVFLNRDVPPGQRNFDLTRIWPSLQEEGPFFANIRVAPKQGTERNILPGKGLQLDLTVFMNVLDKTVTAEPLEKRIPGGN